MTSSTSTSSGEISFWKPEDGFSKTLVISVMSHDESMQDLQRLLESGGVDPTPRFNFVSYDLLHRILAPNRMAIIQTMSGAGPISIRELARRVGRDFKGVHNDISALRKAGLVYTADDGRVVFPYEDIHFDFRVSAAA
nr:transcriptional regulator [Devosia insulae]